MTKNKVTSKKDDIDENSMEENVRIDPDTNTEEVNVDENVEEDISIEQTVQNQNKQIKELKDYKDIFRRSFYKDENIILGTTINKNSNIYNSLVLMHSNLDVQSVYHKNNLVPFGEFLPLENFFHKLGIKKITQGYRSFSSSAKRDLIKYKDFKILPLICYEIIYSGNLNKNKENYDFIVNISEDGWFGNSIGPYQHFSHSIFRSIEEGKNILRSSNNGISAHITPTGDVVNYLKNLNKGKYKNN